MKMKGGYRYFARLNQEEAKIIKTALELLLDMYDSTPEEVNFNWYKDKHESAEVKKVFTEVENSL